MRLRPGVTVVVYPHHVVTLDALDAQNRLFAKAGLGTPSGFIRGEQLHYVRDLLENTDLPLVEVAARAGFLSSSHFTTFVKRKTHQTPLQIRQRRFG